VILRAPNSKAYGGAMSEIRAQNWLQNGGPDIIVNEM